MKFSKLLRGKRAEHPVEVPGYTLPDGKPFVILAQPLTGMEHLEAHASARAQAVEKGVSDPKLGDPVYDIALMACILAVGYVDPDSPEKARTPSFASPEEILKELHPEEIVYLHHRHEVWQDQCSPTTERVDSDNLLAKVREVAGLDAEATFMRLSPSTQVSFAISMARTLLPLLVVRSLPGSNSDESGETMSESDLPKSSEESKSKEESDAGVP